MSEWHSMQTSPAPAFYRPRQIYTGPTLTHYAPMKERK